MQRKLLVENEPLNIAISDLSVKNSLVVTELVTDRTD